MRKKNNIGDEVNEKVIKEIKKLTKLNDLERYAVFMVKVQYIEAQLKGLLITECGYTENKVDSMTLGKIIYQLKKNNLNPYFFKLLDELNNYRIDMAHDFLITTTIGLQIAGQKARRLFFKPLRNALTQVEIVLQVYYYLRKGHLLIKK